MRRLSNNARLLQGIDRWIGVPVCAALTLLRRGSAIFLRARPADPLRRILFLKFAEQGSTVLAHEAIRQAVARVGREHVYFVLFEENRFILDLLGLVPPENVFPIRTRSAGALFLSSLRQLAAIRRAKIDAVIDLEFFARSAAAFGFLTGARTRVGFHAWFGAGPYRGNLLTHRAIYNPHLHTSATFVSLVRTLDADPSTLPTLPLVPTPAAPLPLFRPDEAEVRRVRDLLAAEGAAAGRNIILLNANCGDLLPLRRWSEANYIVLARRLLAEFPDTVVVFTGSADEATRVAPLVREVGSDRCLSLAGRTSLRDLLVLYGLAEVLVTNDSGPAHFAALTPIDVVALFGPETPLLFAAPGPRSHPLWAGIACSPCVNAYNNRQTACRDNQCMKALTVERVFATTAAIHRERLSRLEAVESKNSRPLTADER